MCVYIHTRSSMFMCVSIWFYMCMHVYMYIRIYIDTWTSFKQELIWPSLWPWFQICWGPETFAPSSDHNRGPVCSGGAHKLWRSDPDTKVDLQCNLPINGRILSAAGNFCPLFSKIDCPHGTEVFTGTATLAQGLKAFTEEAPALISAYLHMACSWWHCELRRWFGWSWLLSFLLKASTSRCPRISQEIWEHPRRFESILQILQPAFCIILLQNLLQISWAESTPRTGLGDRIALNVIRVVGGTTNCT